VVGHESKLMELTKAINLIASSQQALFKNQKDLAIAHDNLQDQLNVMVRSLITRVNQLTAVINSLTDNDLVAPITELDIQENFKKLREFKQRPDKNLYAQMWYMGLDDRIPPPPANEETEGEPGPTVEETDGARIFGGDYDQSEVGAETTEQERPEDEAGNLTHALPEVRNEDAPEAQCSG